MQEGTILFWWGGAKNVWGGVGGVHTLGQGVRKKIGIWRGEVKHGLGDNLENLSVLMLG